MGWSSGRIMSSPSGRSGRISTEKRAYRHQLPYDRQSGTWDLLTLAVCRAADKIGMENPSTLLHRYNWRMTGRECYHCKQWIEEGQEHDCWTTTEVALTQDLSEDLQDA